jgi:hypothetical protein
MNTKKRDDDDADLKTNEGERTASDTRPSDREVERSTDRTVLTPENDPKQNEDLGIPGGYTEAQKEKMRASRDEPPNTPDIDPEAELETIKRNTEAALEGRSVDIGSAPKVSIGSSGGKNEVKDGIPTHEMQTQVSNEIDAQRRKDQQKMQAEHDAEAKKIRDTVAADQKKQADEAQRKAKAKEDDDRKDSKR